MYKKCVQAVENERQKPVRNLPQFRVVHSLARLVPNVIRTLHNFAAHKPPYVAQVVHSNFMQNNRSVLQVFRIFHTPYYYYY
jgi:hypothetical protein